MQHVLQYYALSPRLVLFLSLYFPYTRFVRSHARLMTDTYIICARVHVLFYKKSVTHQPPSFSAHSV